MLDIKIVLCSPSFVCHASKSFVLKRSTGFFEPKGPDFPTMHLSNLLQLAGAVTLVYSEPIPGQSARRSLL